MNAKRLIHVSKFLSKHLRHAPDEIGLTLEPGGWVAVDLLFEACHKAGFSIWRSELDQVVADNSKQRFAFDETGQHMPRIRAIPLRSICNWNRRPLPRSSITALVMARSRPFSRMD